MPKKNKSPSKSEFWKLAFSKISNLSPKQTFMLLVLAIIVVGIIFVYIISKIEKIEYFVIPGVLGFGHKPHFMQH